jgi:hypothetical protein
MTLQLHNDPITCTKVSNDIKMIQSIKEHLNYLRWLVKQDYTETKIAENLYIFMKNQRSDIEREDRREAIERRNLLNNGYTKGAH